MSNSSPQQQQPSRRAPHVTEPFDDAAPTDERVYQANSSHTDLHDFHSKYQDPNDTQALHPILRHHPQTNANQGAQQSMQGGALHRPRNAQRAQAMREKRHRLRELQDWEYLHFTTPKHYANPGPIGLLGFGMTTILLNLHNTGVFKLDTVVPSMGICFGGGAQLIAGLLEWVRGNTFAGIAFISYGAFWLSIVCIWMLPNSSFKSWSGITATSSYFLGAYLIVWGVFTFFMFLCTLRMNLAMALLFLTVELLFLLLAGGNMTGNKTALRAAGYEGVVCGSIALYIACAEVVNEVWDRTLMPVFPMTQVIGWFKRGKKTPQQSVGKPSETESSTEKKPQDGAELV